MSSRSRPVRVVHPDLSQVDRRLARVLARAASGRSVDASITDVLHVLRDSVGSRHVSFWAYVGGVPVERAAVPAPGRRRHASDLVVQVPGRGPGTDRLGCLVMAVPYARRPVRPAAERVAGCLGLLARIEVFDAEADLVRERHSELRTALRTAPTRLRTANDVRRRRNVTDVLAATTTPLVDIRRLVRAKATALTSGAPGGLDPTDDMTEALSELTTRFRGVLHSVHSTVLVEHGLRTALEEYAADLPGRVWCAEGDGPPVPAEVVSVLYQAGVAALQILAVDDSVVSLLLDTEPAETRDPARGSAVVLRLVSSTPASPRLLAALAAEGDSMAPFGIDLHTSVDTHGGVSVTISVPADLCPPVVRRHPGGPGPALSVLTHRLEAVCAMTIAAYGDGSAARAAASVADRLAGPLRVAVSGRPEVTEPVVAELRRQSGLLVATEPGAGAPDTVDVDVTMCVLAIDDAYPAPAPVAGIGSRPPPGTGPRSGTPTVSVELTLGTVPARNGRGAAPRVAVMAGRSALLNLVGTHLHGRAEFLRCRSALNRLDHLRRLHPLPVWNEKDVLDARAGLATELREPAGADAILVVRVGPSASGGEARRVTPGPSR